MPVYTVHEPPVKSGTQADAVSTAFVRDGFHFWAFLFGPIWMIWRGLWLVTLLYFVFTAALGTLLYAFKIHGGAYFAIWFLVALLVGIEASTLRRWTLRRRGWKEIAAVVGDDLELAERRFFSASADGAMIKQAPVRAPQSSGPMPRATAPDVVGLFPEPGGPR
jgi:hypothetical protein